MIAMLTKHPLLLFVLALTSGTLLVTSSGLAQGGGHPGKGKGRTKVAICHKGHTIRVGAPAARAHLRHGDTPGRCGAGAPGNELTTLTVVKRVVNDSGGTKSPADFTLTINGVSAAGGNSFPGSASGVTKTLLTTGAYNVVESGVTGYAPKMSRGCSGTIWPGQHRTCVVTNDDIPATLTVVKQVVNDHGGTKTPADFTMTINGVTAIGGNTFAGSAAGVTKVLVSVGAYSVSESGSAGYVLKSASADCSGTIALGQQKTCVLVNDDA